ncbi:hypothetical protein [Massilia sp. YIM B04103]|uniref:hypothetical protein n=1 Tax=Massilia sp. YIM B04103 TaxID=2963106 RepID=UPI00210F2266|nr:hypothetical protein [Massilia sp. YIM B04103]
MKQIGRLASIMLATLAAWPAQAAQMAQVARQTAPPIAAERVPQRRDDMPSCREGLGFAGPAVLTVRFGLMRLLLDPAAAPESGWPDPRPDLLLLSRASDEQLARLAQQPYMSVPLLGPETALRRLRELGLRRLHGLQAFEALDVSKAGVRLRLTAMPAHGGLSALLDFQQGWRNCRIYVSGEEGETAEQIAERLPGADMAVLWQGGERVIRDLRRELVTQRGPSLQAAR